MRFARACIEPQEDSVRIDRLCGECAAGIEILGVGLISQRGHGGKPTRDLWSSGSETSPSTCMQLGGLVGKLVLDGELHSFGDLLRTAESINGERGATFGLGKIAVQ